MKGVVMTRDIKKIRAAVLANRGLPATITDAQVRLIWNSFDAQMQAEYMSNTNKLSGGKKNVTNIDGRKLRGSAPRTQGPGKPPDVSV